MTTDSAASLPDTQVFIPLGMSQEEAERIRGYYQLSRGMERVGPWGRLPRVYAEALLAAAEQQGVVAEVAAALDALVQEVFPAVEGLEAYLASPAVSRRRKDELIVQLFEGRTVPLFVDFLRLLNRNGRLELLRAAAIAFREMEEQRAGRRRVLIESAAPLEEPQARALAEALQPLIGGTPVLIVRVRPELIGGLVVRVGDRVFDTTIRSRIQTLRLQLLARGSHEIQSRRDRFCIA